MRSAAARVTTAAEGLPRRRFTVAEVEAMVSAGVMDEDESDLDILVDPGETLTFFDLARLERELPSVLGCRVDVTTPGGLSAEAAESAARDMKAFP